MVFCLCLCLCLYETPLVPCISFWLPSFLVLDRVPLVLAWLLLPFLVSFPFHSFPWLQKPHSDESYVPLSAADMYRVVRLEGVDKAASKDDVEKFFCKEFEGVVKVVESKSRGKASKTNKPHPRWFELTFKDESAAKVFLDKDELKYKERTLKAQLLKDTIQFSRVRWSFNLLFSHNLRMMDCIPMEKGKEDTYIMVYGIGRPTEEELKAYFMGVESEFENIVSVKSVIQNFEDGVGAANGKLLGILVQFENRAALDKFVSLGEIKYKEKVVRYNIISDVNNELREKKVNYQVDDGPTTQELSNRRLIVIRMKENFSPEVEKKIKSIFPEARNVGYCGVDKVAILTFANADIAHKALRNLKDDSDLVAPLNVMPLSKYLEIREKLLEQDAAKIERIKEKYQKIANNTVVVDGNTIKISVPLTKKLEQKVKKEKEKKEAKEKKVEENKELAAAPKITNPILRKRANRGRNAFDTYVGVRGFNQHIRNMGKATDMDVCNYFIHNHKDVTDVKFVNWTSIVFARFKNAEAAERFIGLSYHMFYGIDLALTDVVDFLKKKTDAQKEEVAKVLLNKKFTKNMLEGTGGGAATNGAAIPKTNEKPEMELGGFANKKAGDGIRDLLIENLHLDSEDVGQPKWMKTGDEFKARFAIKMDDNAIGYFVKKWNDLNISVSGETVKAELTVQPPKDRTASKRGRKRPNNLDNKRAKISPEDY